MAIAQLQVLTSYSLLASTNRISELVERAKADNYDALAITDINVMYGAIEFYQTCKKNDIKPIIGLTLEYFKDNESDTPYRLILLAKNVAGYQNLLNISSLKMEADSQTKLTLSDFAAFFKDVYIITPGYKGELEELVATEAKQEAIDLVKEWQHLFAQTDLFAGVYADDKPEEHTWQDFATENQLPLLALHDVRYLEPMDDFSFRVVQHIQEGSKLSLDKMADSGAYFLPSAKEMKVKFEHAGLEEALRNVDKIVHSCQVEISLNQSLLPNYPVPANQTAESYLRHLCYENLPKRIDEVTDEYRERLEMELQVIHEMGFDDYFLIVWDVIAFAHDHKIVTGAGRGSAAGSLVSYVLAITEVDPLKYQLLFERFLNKERYTMPDIDLDFPDNRRDEVLHYVLEKYGSRHVAQIVTFGTMAAKMALRDVARVFGLSQSEANEWSNAIPNVLKISLEEAYRSSHKLQKIVTQSERNQKLFETAKKIEGLPRHVSTHAAAVVISDQELTKFVPLQEGTNGIALTQFVMGDVENIGLLKMDFLGLRNLSIIDHAVQHIRRAYQKEITVKEIPLDDPATLQLFQKADTVGVFQFESAGIRNVLRKLGPTSLEDIAAVNALYRPGPMDNIDLFIARKKGKEPIEYPDVSLIPILEVTYGIIVYQEQIMQVASKMAGYSLGQADILRRAISKKKKEVLDSERAHFVQGAVAKGYQLEIANRVYDYVERFANYGFNRSHAVAYSFIAYQMAYLKVYYPVPFFVSLLHSVRHNPTKIKEYIAEAKRFSVTIKGPDINKSEYSFFLSKNKILFGFTSIKGMRRDFVHDILKERKANGIYTSLENFLLRTNHKWLKEDTVLPLIFTGAFDSVHGNRRQLVMNLKKTMENILLTGGSQDLLDQYPLKEETVADYSVEEKLAHEEEFLGTYLSGHPVEEFAKIKVSKSTEAINQVEVGKKTGILLYSKEVRIIRTKKGESMAFLTGSDQTAEISVTIFPRLYRQIQQTLEKNKVYYCYGKIEKSNYNQELQLLAEECVRATDLEASTAKVCYLKITKENEKAEILNELKDVLKQFHGQTKVVLYYENNAQKIMLGSEFSVTESPVSQEQLGLLLGTGNVVFR